MDYTTMRCRMQNRICFECGAPATEEHHVIPACLGGTKTVPLCLRCHSLVHDKDMVSMRELSKCGTKANQYIRTQIKKVLTPRLDEFDDLAVTLRSLIERVERLEHANVQAELKGIYD